MRRFVLAHSDRDFQNYKHIIERHEVIKHYDLMIEENNDPVHDPEPLKAYMDKWDGQDFIHCMELDSSQSVLEIGVGTGRLAIRIAPLCSEFTGIDISPKTIERAKENLSKYSNVKLICRDFLEYNFERTFDVVYSSLTFMHIKEKLEAITKVEKILSDTGRFVLSIDKNQSEYIDYGTRQVKVFPDTAEDIVRCIIAAGLIISNQYNTENATIFVAQKATNKKI